MPQGKNARILGAQISSNPDSYVRWTPYHRHASLRSHGRDPCPTLDGKATAFEDTIHKIQGKYRNIKFRMTGLHNRKKEPLPIIRNPVYLIW